MKGIHRLELTDLAVGGECIGKQDTLVFFVPFGVPGDIVDVEETELKKNYARGKILNIIKPSPHRVEPRCPIFYRCGGCHLQQMNYPSQLFYKKKMIEDAVMFLGNIRHVQIKDCIGASEPWFYRNKVQVVVASKPYMPSKEPRNFPYLGLYARKTHQVVKMDNCVIQHNLNNKVIKAAGDTLKKLNWEVYNENTGAGYIRFIISRVSVARDEVLLTLVTARTPLPKVQEFIQMIRQKVPQIKGIIENHNPQKTNVILGSQSRVLWGKDNLLEEINGLQFKISSASFFQVNPEQFSNLLKVIETYANLKGTETVVDAYSGVGAISLWLAKKSAKVIGIEENSRAVADARENAIINRLKNIEFHAGQMERVFLPLVKKGLKTDLVVLDPPRKGCAREVLDILVKMKVSRIIYVSCNPSTLARDLAILSEKGYMVLEIQPIDMFPQTAHVECVAKIIIKEKS